MIAWQQNNIFSQKDILKTPHCAGIIELTFIENLI